MTQIAFTSSTPFTPPSLPTMLDVGVRSFGSIILAAGITSGLFALMHSLISQDQKPIAELNHWSGLRNFFIAHSVFNFGVSLLRFHHP